MTAIIGMPPVPTQPPLTGFGMVGSAPTPAPAPAPTPAPIIPQQSTDTAFRDGVNANLRNPAVVADMIRNSGARNTADLAARMGYPTGQVGEDYIRQYAQSNGLNLTQLFTPAPAPAPAPAQAPALSPLFGMVGSGASANPGPMPSPAPAPGGIIAPVAGTSPTPAPAPGVDVAFRDTINANLRDPAKVAEIIRGSGATSVAQLATMMGYPAGPVGEGYVRQYLETNGISPESLNQLMGNRTAPITTASTSASGSAELGSPTRWNVDPTQTVEGRIQSIINPNNPLMQQARTRAMEQANARGLMNSSLAATAGESAMIDAAMPIAQADAATFAKSASYNADQSNQFAVRNVDADNQFRLRGMDQGQQRNMAAFERETQQQLAQINRDTQTTLAGLDATNKAAAEATRSANDRLLNTNNQAATAFNQAVSAVSAIQNNKDLDGNNKTQAVSAIYRDLQTQLRVLGTVAGLNLTSALNFAGMPGFDAQGGWIGFSAGTPAPSPAPAAGIVNGVADAQAV